MDIRRYFAPSSRSSSGNIEPAMNDSVGAQALSCESEESVLLQT